MTPIYGTPKAMKIINSLKASGDLIDYYSEEVFNRRANSGRSKTHLKNLENEYGDDFKHHLLIGCFHGYADEEKNLTKLVKLAGPLNDDIFKQRVKHCLVFINLMNRSILYMGITERKKHFYESIIFSVNPETITSFDKLDYDRIIDSFRVEMEQIANAMNDDTYNLGRGELDSMVLDKNRKHHYDNDVEEIEGGDEDDGDDEESEYTKEGLDEQEEQAGQNEHDIDEGVKSIKHFFPKFSTDFIYG